MSAEALELLETKEEAKNRLNTLVAVTIALLATFMGICSVKADNIAQRMAEAQSNKIDYWTWYQARNIREEVMRATSEHLSAMPGAKAEAVGAKYADMAKDQMEKKDKLELEAKGFEEEYERLGKRDDQFDFSDAALTISIAILALTVLTERKFLFWISLVPATAGIVVGFAGLFGLSFNFDSIAKLLG